MTRPRGVAGRLVPPVLLLVVAFAGPGLLSHHQQNLGLQVALYATAGAGIVMLTGYAGQISFGQVAFWSIGSYTYGILTVRHGVPVLVAVVLTPVVASLIALVVGWPLLRLRGHSLAMGTLAFALITSGVINNLTSLTGGAIGLSGVPPVTLFGRVMTGPGLFQLSWIVLAVVLVLVTNVARSRTGRALRGLAIDEDAAAALGVPVAAHRLRVFVLSAAATSVAGIVYAMYVGFISPDAFPAEMSIWILLVALIGGLLSPYGSVIGALAVVGITNYLSSIGTTYHLPARVPLALNLVVYGLLIILVVRLVPDGLVPTVARWARPSRYRKARPAPPARHPAGDDPGAVGAAPLVAAESRYRRGETP